MKYLEQTCAARSEERLYKNTNEMQFDYAGKALQFHFKRAEACRHKIQQEKRRYTGLVIVNWLGHHRRSNHFWNRHAESMLHLLEQSHYQKHTQSFRNWRRKPVCSSDR